MRPYQERYLARLGTMRQEADLSVERVGAEAFVDVVRQASEETRQLVEEGTQLLRGELFPLLDDILSASPEELQDLVDFADKLEAACLGTLEGGTMTKDLASLWEGPKPTVVNSHEFILAIRAELERLLDA